MINLLRKTFIKDYKNVNDPLVRQKHGVLASLVGGLINLLLCAFKITIGLLISSISIISDAINNLMDMASCIVNLLGFKLANKPADKKHPFGHERIEYIAGLIISFIIIIIAVIVGYTSIDKIISQKVYRYDQNITATIFTFIILFVAIIFKLLQAIFYKRMSKIINSLSLKAASQDSLNDVISTSGVLLATGVECILVFNGINFQLDGYMGLLVSIFIVIMGIKLVIETSNPLIGECGDIKLVKEIKKDILGYEGVLGIHDVLCHSYGPTKMFMSVHVEVDYRKDIMTSHDLIDNIEEEIAKKYNILLCIHMDPIVVDSKEVDELKKYTSSLLSSYSKFLSFHDFRIVSGPTHTNVLFDIVVPFETKLDVNHLLEYLKNQYKEKDQKYNLVIKIDHDYVDDD